MGIFAAAGNGVSGQSAAVHWLQNISNNVANSETPGFKRGDTSFVDLVRHQTSNSPLTGGVLPYTRSTNAIQGDVKTSETSTHMSLKGNGYFVVDTASDTRDGRVVFSEKPLYTRRGDFEPDQYGYLVNGAGHYLKGIAVDRTTGNVIGDSPEQVRIETNFLPPKKSTEIEYKANLASHPMPSNASREIKKSELLDPANYAGTSNPTVAGTGVVIGTDASRFVGDSISGGALTTYNDEGAAVNVQMRWSKISSSEYGDANVWNLFYQTDKAAAGTDPAWKNIGVNFEFDDKGTLTSPTTGATITNLSVNGVDVGDVKLGIGASSLTQFSDADGTVEVTHLSQDGYSSGEFKGVDLTKNGRVRISYSNGKSVEIAEVAVVRFNAENRLEHEDGSAFRQSIESGGPILVGAPKIQPSTLEAANLDIAEEIIKMMGANYYFSSNLRTMKTAGDMHKEFINITQ